jgi:hypothetical protein
MVAAAYLGPNPFVEFGSAETPQLADAECWNLTGTSQSLERFVVDLQQRGCFLRV